MPVNARSEVIMNEEIGASIFFMSIKSPEIAAMALPGQFINMKCSDGLDAYLRRPISICDANADTGIVNVVYQIRGKGTLLLSKCSEGDKIDILGPLGYHGFSVNKSHKRIAVVGGGIGIFPLLFLSKKATASADAFLGYRSKEFVVMEKLFDQVCDDVSISTDDGSYGRKGLVTGPLEESMKKKTYDCVYACGPLPMLKAVVKLCEQYNIECEVSLEQRMGCGIGACLVCVCEIKADNEDGWKHLHVCKDGPVFNGKEVLL